MITSFRQPGLYQGAFICPSPQIPPMPRFPFNSQGLFTGIFPLPHGPGIWGLKGMTKSAKFNKLIARYPWKYQKPKSAYPCLSRYSCHVVRCRYSVKVKDREFRDCSFSVFCWGFREGRCTGWWRRPHSSLIWKLMRFVITWMLLISSNNILISIIIIDVDSSLDCERLTVP